MTMIFEAECAGGVVTVEGVTILPAPIILTKGVKSSTGILFLLESLSFYVAANSTDIEDLIPHVTSALSAIGSALTTIAGATGDPGAIAAATSANTSISTAVSGLNSIKENLK